MTPSKKLMREFAKVVLPGYYQAGTSGTLFSHERRPTVFLNNWQTVIELAEKWSEDGLVMQYLIKGKWRVFVGFNEAVDDKHLPTAIMKAIVEAARKP